MGRALPSPLLVAVLLSACGGGWKGVVSDDIPPADRTVAALPAGTIVYIHDGREIRTLDVETGETTVVTRAARSSIDGIALSPDRKTIAFTSMLDFDPVRYPLGRGIPTQSIRTIGVDGKRLRTVLSPFADDEPAVRCDVDATCAPMGQTCDAAIARCRDPLHTRAVTDLAWSADGREIWFAFADHRWDGAEFMGGTKLGRVSVLGGRPNIVDTSTRCAENASPAPSRFGFASRRGVCTDSNTEIVVDDRPVLKEGEHDLAIAPDRVVWLPRGEGVVFVAYGPAMPNGGVVAYLLDEREIRPLFVAGAGKSIDGFALSPDGGDLVLGLSAGTTADLFVVDLSEATPRAEPLTNDGKSRLPRW